MTWVFFQQSFFRFVFLLMKGENHLSFPASGCGCDVCNCDVKGEDQTPRLPKMADGRLGRAWVDFRSEQYGYLVT